MRHLLASVSLLSLISLVPLHALASADCPAYPKEEWGDKEVLKNSLKEEGYKIKKFHVSGNCYEMYGRNKEGKKVEIYFDAKTFAVIKAEVQK